MKLLKIYIFICFAFLSAQNFLCGQTIKNEERTKGWQSDIDTLLVSMKRGHYVYSKKPLSLELLKKAADLKKNIGKYSDERMLMEMERLMYYMHDGHSYVLPLSEKVKAFWLPVWFYIFSDGVFIIDADEAYKDMIGCKVLSIGGIEVYKLVNDMNSYVHQDNKFTVKWLAPTFLKFRAVYESYGLKAGATGIVLKFANQNKKEATRKIKFIPVDGFHGIPKLIPSKLLPVGSAPLYLAKVEDNYWYNKIAESDAIYVQFNQVLHKNEGEDLFQFGNRLDSILKVNKPKLLIVDVRHNNGGSLEYLPNLVKAITNYDKEKSSRIIVITGRNTFSACQIFITQLNRDTKAIFAGEPSASSPNFVGEEIYSQLPYSKAVISISNIYHETIPGDKRKWIEPQIPIYLTSKRYFKNQDPVLEYILKR